MVTYLAALSWTISIMFTSVSPNRNGSTDESCEIHVTNRQQNTSSFGDMLQHLKRHSFEDQLRAACLVMKYIIYHDKVAVSRSDRLSPPMRHSRNVHSQPYQVSLCKTQQKDIIFPSQHCRLEPHTPDSSAEWLGRVLQARLCYFI